MKGVARAFGALFLNKHGRGGRNEDAPAVEEGPKATILVIDDDAAMLGVLRPVVRAAGYNVLATSSAAKGLDMLRFDNNNVRLVVLDYSMPILNGADALVHLRKLKPHVKVIGLTGFKGDDLPESFGRGVDQLLAKPCSNAHLVACIQMLVGGPTSPSPA